MGPSFRLSLRSLAAMVAAAGALPALAGCGAEEKEQVQARPPAPVVVSASIVAGRLSVSPTSVGAGPVTFVIANQTDRSRSVTLETAGSGEGLRQETGPISPQDTAQLQAEVPEGSYRLSADGGSVTGATLRVGARRGTSENELLLP